MKHGSPYSFAREALLIVILASVLALVYNGLSPHGLPLVGVEPRKIPVSDSVLFQSPNIYPGAGDHQGAQTTKSGDAKVIAPLHERAFRNSDSMKALVQASAARNVYRVITLPQFKRLRAERKGILFDARAAEDYKKSRISGAKNIPGQETDHHFEDVVELPRDTLIIIYCNNPDCHLGRILAEFLHAVGFGNIVMYDDGWDGWLLAKEPIDTSRIIK